MGEFRLLVSAGLGLLIWAVATCGVTAHSLGVDKAELRETNTGIYALISKVPERLAHLITTPALPSFCKLQGNPAGERGIYEVRFNFICERRLTASDVIRLPWQREGVMLTVNWTDAEPVTRFTRRDGATITINLNEFLAGSGSLWAAAKRYTALGIEHILSGIDHLLFVFGLMLLVSGGWMLVKTITAFTVAHSITLGLATLGFVDLPSEPVEVAIALSIVFLAVEVVYSKRGRSGLSKSFPWVVSFGFGLLHGLGFAGALSEIGLPPNEIPQALLFFNIGVEIGQLMFVAMIYPVIWLTLRSAISIPQWATYTPAYVVGTISMYWFAERLLTMFGVT